MRGQLLVEPHQRVFFVFADQEADDHHRLTRARRRIEILDARNLPEQLLERARQPLLDFHSTRARHRQEHIDHRHDDLRLFLARQSQHGEDAQQHGSHHEQRRQLRMDEGRGHPSGEASFDNHGRSPVTRTSAPSTSDAGGFTITALAGLNAGEHLDRITASAHQR